jgi:ABC-2 type transport system permease protein
VLHALNVFRTSFWLGWENESNWTWRPFYFLYAALRPLAMCLILYFLFRIASPDPSANPAFVSVYLGNAFFTIFMAVTGGIGWVIIEDREFFRLIRYIVIAPMHYTVYLLGRTFLVLLVSISSLFVILLFGAFVLGVPISLSAVRWPLLLGSFVLGLASTASLGMILAAFVLLTARHASLLAEGIGGAFLLLCGVIYPIDFLPGPVRIFAMGIPLTYWMEATRRALYPVPFGRVLAGWTSGGLMAVLAATTALLVLASMLVFRLCFDYAKAHGKIDQITHY